MTDSTERPRRQIFRALQPPLWCLLATTIVGCVWSVSDAGALDVWAFELVPGTLGVLGLVVLAPRFQFCGLTCGVLAVCYAMMAAGARYSFAEIPVFNWLQDVLQLSRNHGDRLGHFLQGVAISLMTREVLWRTTELSRNRAVPILTVMFALAFSAFYELVEWWCVAVFYPHAGPEWLGLQGDVWDAHWDMMLALSGGLVTIGLLESLHERSVGHLEAALQRQEASVSKAVVDLDDSAITNE